MALDDELRVALHAMGGNAQPSWDAVVQSARRLRRVRALAATSALLVLIGGGAAALALRNNDHHHVSISTPRTSTTTSTTTSSSTSTTTTTQPFSGETHLTNPPVTPPTTEPPAPTTTTPPPYEAYDPNAKWTATVSADETTLHVGESTVLHATLTNVGDRAMKTSGYGSIALGCGDVGTGFGDGNTVLPPGGSISTTLTYTAVEQDIGTVTCGVGVDFHGDINVGGSVGAVKITVMPAG